MAMPLTTSNTSSFSVALLDELATRRLAVDIANALERGDLVTLSGDLGTGKTTFARALIRYLAGDPALEVPSPTFTLMQIYDLPQFPLVHADFYRLSGSAELLELGFDDLPEGAVVLVEWPDRAAGFLPPDRIDIALSLAPKLKLEFRHARVTGQGASAPRIDRMAAARQFIAESGYSEALRAADARRCLDPVIRASGARRQARNPHEHAAPPRWAAGARRQALQRDRASRRQCRAIRGDGERAAATRLLGARHPSRRS